MDHLGTGKPWDLSRKREGMFILPPFNSAEDSGGLFANRIDALVGCASFISSSTNEYVLLCDCNTICNIDINLLFDAHEQSGADITVAYCHGTVPALNNTMTFDLDSDGRIKEIAISSVGGEEGDYSLNVFLLKKSLLERLISQAASMHYTDFERDLIQANVGVLKICGYKTEALSSLLTRSRASMTPIWLCWISTAAPSCSAESAPYIQRYAMRSRLFTDSARRSKTAL